MEVFVAGEVLREQRGAAHGAVGVDDEAAVGLVAEQQLAARPDDERIDAAAATARTSVETTAAISEKRAFMEC